MTPRSFNTEADVVPAIVISTDDPEARGRVQVQRLDQSEIPPDKCPWIFIHNQEHFPQVFGKDGKSIGASTHVLLPGNWVNVPKKSSDNQTAIGGGSIATNGTEGNNGG